MFIKYPLKVILIDNDDTVLEIMEMFLEDNNDIHVMKFTDPIMALEFIKQNDVHIVISDINMEKMYGDDLLRNVNTLEKGIQVILVTGKLNLIEIHACFRCSASTMFKKPFGKEAFMKAVNHCKKNIDRWNSNFQKVVDSKNK